MANYVVTGAASGMGAAVACSLRAAGHTVIGVDRDGGQPEDSDSPQGGEDPGTRVDVVADLSTPEGRRHAIAEVLEHAGGTLDGAVLAAGLGPTPGSERTIVEVNVLGVTELLTGFHSALAAADRAKVVVFGSNSTTSTPFIPRAAVRKLLDGDTAGATRVILRRKGMSAPIAYAASKVAVSHWCRLHGTRPDWAGQGIRVNVIAPGPVLTPLLQAQLDSPNGKSVRSFPVPVREYGTPEQLASWVMLMLSDAADFMAGSVVTVDGGTEALLRPRAWPKPTPVRSVPAVLWRLIRAARAGQRARY